MTQEIPWKVTMLNSYIIYLRGPFSSYVRLLEGRYIDNFLELIHVSIVGVAIMVYVLYIYILYKPFVNP